MARRALPDRRLGTRRFRHSGLLILVVGAGVVTFPYVWMLLSSFKSGVEIGRFPPTLIPEEWRFSNYHDAWFSPPSTFGRYYLNSTILAVGGVALQTSTSVLAAYAFAAIRFRGRNLLFAGFLLTMMIPDELIMIPNFVVIRHIPLVGGNNWMGTGGQGLFDSHLGMMLPNAASAFAVFFLRQAFLALPRDLWDAAQIDGCGRFRYLCRVALPLVKPALITVIVFGAFQYWNSLIWPLILTNSEALRPIQLAILYFQDEVDRRFNLVLAAATISMLPGIIFYFFAGRHFQRGLAQTGLKG